MWLILGILLLSETRYSCPNMTRVELRFTIWCALSATTGGLSLIITLLSTIVAVTIFSSSRQSPLGLWSPVVGRDRSHDAGPLKGEMHAPTIVRTVLYSLVIVLGILQSSLAVMHALLTDREHLKAFSGLSASVSMMSWVGASVLLSYNRRPSVTRTLTRASTHCCTLGALAVLNVVCGNLILAYARPEDYDQCTCVAGGNGLCWTRLGDGVMSLVLAVPLASSAAYIYVQTRRGGGSLWHSDSNVARFDGEGPEALDREEILRLDP
ncbi:hypothetical protein V5O48_007552 [Marasmius crinis-equi]|uniref:Uncharacterized protein n=1 Tax=Marasmius crinis-equi TaxID=585013 RepID=A0ABR3FH45_9AGAR